ncbi:hypothetical protein [Streptomyces viridosporus]|uniref:hypothetical protein n=1 Tax=Streptomyces viridosporus TaxID=67581 RepID=UPI0036FB5E8F
MSAETSSSPGPVFTRVRLVGSPEEVGRLTGLLGGAAEVIFGSPSEPDARGEIERVVEEAVTQSLQSLPQVRRASSRVVSLWGLPAAPE